jgi:hypothetical protein
VILARRGGCYIIVHLFYNIGQILDRAGVNFRNVAEFTAYLVGRESIPGFLQARAELFPSLYPDGDYPPNTLLIVSGLVREDFLVEIKAVAALPCPTPSPTSGSAWLNGPVFRESAYMTPGTPTPPSC